MQYAGYGDSAAANANFKRILESGGNGISIAFDLPSQLGLDPTSEIAKHEVGRVGVSINDLEDMRNLLSGLPLQNKSISMTINSTAVFMLLLVEIVLEEIGLNPSKSRGTLQNDILKEFICRGTQVLNIDDSMALTGHIFEYIQNEMPLWKPISVSGYHMAEAGADAVHEVAFTIANALEYIYIAEEKGLDLDSFVDSMSFFFSLKLNIVEEIAKLRAARITWSKIIRRKFPHISENSIRMKIHGQTAGSELTTRDPENNIARVTLQSLAGVLGGVQSLHTNSFDEGISLPSNYASSIAINTQHLIQMETDLCKYVDIMNGSKEIFNLTRDLCEGVEDLVEDIVRRGGASEAIKHGYQKRILESLAYEREMKLQRNEIRKVGVNFGATIPRDSSTRLEFQTHSVHKDSAIKKRKIVPLSNLEKSNLHDVINSGINPLVQVKNLLKRGTSVSSIMEEFKKTSLKTQGKK